MGILLAFAPFIVYVVAERISGISTGLLAAAVTAAALLVRDALSHRKLKILEIGTFLLFGGLAAYAYAVGVSWSIPSVRLRVDGGLLFVVILSIAVRQPFTLQYARETVPSESWNTPDFVRTNYVLSAVWAAAFAVMVAADLAMLHIPDLSRRTPIIVTILAIWGAFRFTSWYPDRNKSKKERV